VSGFSQHYAAAILGHTWSKSELAKPSKVFLALCTTVPTSSSTGSTIVEATASGYERKEVPTASIASPTEAAESSIKTSAELLFKEITGGSSTIIGWALCDASTGGNVVMWGTCTSTVISPTQTPPKIASGTLEGLLK
jgi:hypothetical protein